MVSISTAQDGTVTLSTGYDPSTGDFITSDSHASLTVDSYWENYLGI